MIICRKEKMPTALVPLYGLQVLVKKKSSILVLRHLSELHIFAM